VEVAHNQVFNYGYLTWEWEKSSPIRSPVFPGLFALYYFILKALNIDTPWLVVKCCFEQRISNFSQAHGPRVIHSLISGLFDFLSVKLAVYLTNNKNVWFWVTFLWSSYSQIFS